jgi:hypothetical protein
MWQRQANQSSMLIFSLAEAVAACLYSSVLRSMTANVGFVASSGWKILLQ